MNTDPLFTRIPKVPLERRGAALVIDFFVIWLASGLLGGGTTFGEAVIFTIGWFVMRVVLVYKNQGQSLGRYALDMKLLDARLGKVPGLQAILKREGIIGGGALLAAIGLSTLRPTNWTAILLVIPLAADCGIAWNDPVNKQAFHDRIGRTIVVATRRGYSLDLKVKKLLAQAKRYVQR